MATEPKIIPASTGRRREPGDLCDLVKRLGGSVGWIEGDSDAKLYGWEHPEYKESAELFEDAEDAAEHFVRHLMGKLAYEFDLCLLPKAPPTCRCCGAELSVECLDKVVKAANEEARKHTRGRLEIGMIVGGVLIESIAKSLQRYCLRCAVKELYDGARDTDSGQAATAIKAAMMQALDPAAQLAEAVV